MLPGGLHDWPPVHVRSSCVRVSHSVGPGLVPIPSQNTPYEFGRLGSVSFVPPQQEAVLSQ
jgi:hypothetical protein